MLNVAEYILSFFIPLIKSSEAEISTLGTVIPIPRFDPEDFLDLCRVTLTLLKKEPPLLYLEPPVFVLGDIHGDIHDLLRVLSKIFNFLSDKSAKILMLGDYIDRGGFSTEVVLLIFSLMSCYPENFFFLRGNHEFPGISSVDILDVELNSLYGKTPLFDEIHRVFSYLPLAAVIGDSYFAVHGGLSPKLITPSDINQVEYPIVDVKADKLVEDILWSDPCAKIAGFIDSTRGKGTLFGSSAIQTFLQHNNFKMIIRAHQCVINGISLFNDNVITVFTTSFYNSEENKGGFLKINEAQEVLTEILVPLRTIRRQQAIFTNISKRKTVILHPIAKSLLAAQTKSGTGRTVKPPLARPRPRGRSVKAENRNSFPVATPIIVAFPS
ncbi:hypothetical protein M9Y10_013151 [Tritrichomonas musculus]|uniref:Serine/threonine-protein phosphatase n=1 Tax=Tritrichomonas musculus TaxID=1915356 RepID=A0ABR2I6K9_9EUKA